MKLIAANDSFEFSIKLIHLVIVNSSSAVMFTSLCGHVASSETIWQPMQDSSVWILPIPPETL